MTGLEMRYFVLKIAGNSNHAYACREALRTYASLIRPVNGLLADELDAWADREQAEADRITQFQSDLDYEDD